MSFSVPISGSPFPTNYPPFWKLLIITWPWKSQMEKNPHNSVGDWNQDIQMEHNIFLIFLYFRRFRDNLKFGKCFLEIDVFHLISKQIFRKFRRMESTHT